MKKFFIFMQAIGLLVLTTADLLAQPPIQQVRLSTKKKNAFKAPAIYSVTHAMYRVGDKDSVKTYSPVSELADSGSGTVIVRDTLSSIVNDLHLYKADTGFQHQVMHGLDSIQGQLKKLKTIARNQAFEARYQYLQFKQDSLKQLKKMIQLRKPPLRDENLLLRIYDLQADSLRHEMNNLQHRAEAGLEDNDTSWMQPVYHQVAFAPNTASDSLFVAADTVKNSTDTLSQQQLAEMTMAYSQLQHDKRYAQDSSYRSTIDSLNKKLARYEALSKHYTAALRNDNNTDSSTTQQTTGKQANLARDTLVVRDSANATALQALKEQVQQNSDSLKVLQANLKYAKDSADYYKRMSFAAHSKSAAANEQPKKWYQRILPGKSSKKEKSEQEAELQQADDKEKYYDDQLKRLNDQVNTLQQRNLQLNTDYEKGRQQHVERVYEPAVGTTVRERRTDNTELYALRSDINALRNQLLVQQSVQTGFNRIPAQAGSRRGPDTVYIQQPAPVMTTPVQTQQANPQMLAMQDEIAALKKELETVKTNAAEAPVVAVKPDSARPAKTIKPVTVYFGLGSASLARLQVNKLEAFAKKAAEDNTSLLLTAYTDATGNPAANTALAQKRIKYVQNMLVTAFNIPANNIQEDEPVIGQAKSAKENALERKVVVSVKQ